MRLTLLDARRQPLPPAPIPRNLHFSDDALGWLKGTIWPTFTAVAIFDRASATRFWR